jgi:hypothetical protein
MDPGVRRGEGWRRYTSGSALICSGLRALYKTS